VSRALADAATRREAVTCFDANIVVVAGAGTGKTSLLVERFLNLVLSGRVSLDRAVAVTFTRKAAGELRVRLAEAFGEIVEAIEAKTATTERDGEAARSLAWLREGEGDDGEILARARRALETLEGAAVGTIHGFASDLLRRHPVEAGLPPDAAPDEGEAQRLLFETLWPRFLAEELGEEGERRDAWHRVLASFAPAEVEAIAWAATRSPVALDLLARDGYTPTGLLDSDGASLRDDAALLRAARKELKPGCALDQLMGTQLLLIERLSRDDVDGWDRLNEAELQPSTFWTKTGKEVFAATGIKDPDRRIEVDSLARRVQGTLRRLRKTETRDLASLGAVLQVFAARFIRECSRTGVLFFDDLLLRARNLLRDHPDIREVEAERARAILLDEFQDTDPLQYELVFLLAARPGAGGGDSFSLPLEPGRLFIVGDPKQSIYRFRRADIAMYHRAVNHVVACGGRRLVLESNFRSVPGVIEPVNRLFTSWMGADDPESEPHYDPIVAVREENPDPPPVELWSVITPPDAKAAAQREAEASVIAARLRADREAGIPYGDTAILFRALTRIPIYTRALREAGVDYVVGGGRSFPLRPEVVEAVALLRALGNPSDPVAVLAVLRSPLGGVADRALARFTGAGGHLNYRRRVDDALRKNHPDVLRGLDRLERLDRETRDLAVDRRILTLLTEGAFPILQAAAFEGAQRTANVRKLAYRAAQLARDRVLSLEETVRCLEDEFTGDFAEGESPLADEAVDAVRLLSVHAAKGLEFPRVILPDLRKVRNAARSGARVRVVEAGGERRPALRTEKKGDALSLAAEEEDAVQDRAESKRLCYVAMTRARDRLVMVTTLGGANAEWIKPLAEPWGYAVDPKDPGGPFPEVGLLADGWVRHRILGPEAETGAPDAKATVPVTPAVEALQRVAAISADAPRVGFRTPSADHRARAADEVPGGETSPVEAAHPSARWVGTLVHKALETFDPEAPERSREVLARLCETAAPPGDGTKRARAGGTAAPSSAATTPDGAAVRTEATAILDAFLASELSTRLARAEILGREVPVLFRDEEGIVVHGYIDLVYRLDGVVHVADYKTDRLQGSPRTHAAQYSSQVADYANAVTRALDLPQPPVREVWFVRTGDRVVLSPR